MSEPQSPPTTVRLVLWPALASLGVTLLRLTGELRHWSPRWFSTETGGVVPSGLSWIVGITWLAIPFGIYFALRLRSLGAGPRSFTRAVLLALAGAVACALVWSLLLPRLQVPFPQVLVFIWGSMVLAAALPALAWPALGRTLLAYALSARVPVVVVMLLAMRGSWGTHYDYVGMPPQFQMSLWPKFFWLAFFPQLVFWVAYTVLLGSLVGSLAAALVNRMKRRGTSSARLSVGL